MAVLLLENVKKAIINIFTMVGYSERMMPLIGYINILFQFAWLYLLKILNQKSGLNQTLINLSQSLSSVLTGQFFIFFSNLVISFLVLAISISAIIFTKKTDEEQSNSRGFFNFKNIYWLISRLFTILRFLFLPFLVINLNAFNALILNTPSNVFAASNALFVIAVINALIIAIIIFVYSQGMLLEKWTFLMVFLSLQFGTIDIAMKIVSILALLTLSLKKSPFERILIRLLLFIFVMDFLAFIASVTISLMHFIVFNLLIVVSEFVRPDEGLLSEAERQNETLMESLQKLNKSKRLQKRQEINLLTIVFKNREKIEQFANYFTSASCENPKEFFERVNVQSFEWLSTFFKLKLEVNVKQSPHNLSFKLQQTIFCLKFQKITIKMLTQIVKIARQAEIQMNFSYRILIMQVEELIKEKHFKKKEQIHNYELVNISKKIELFYKSFFETIQTMPTFWYRLKFNALSEDQLFSILNDELKKEKQMKAFIEEIIMYKNSKPEVKLYDYAMKLLNFDYQPKMLRKGEIQFGNSELVSSHYIYLTQNKITEVSNQVLADSKWKRQQIIDENYDILIPHQLKNYLQNKFDNALQSVKDPQEFILPFIQMREFLMPYKIKIDIRFSLITGIRYVIHFLKSQQLQQSPTFLYSLDSDQIVNFCPLFKEYIKLHKRKLSTNILGSQLFGVDLSNEINENGKKVNDKIFCALKRQKEHQQTIPLVFMIKNIYLSGVNRYALIQIQRKYADNLAKNETIENLITSIEEQKNVQAKLYRQNIQNEEFFCKIANPYQSLVSQKMNKLSINCRKSNPKFIILITVLFFCLFCASVIFINEEVDIMANNYQNLINLSSQDSTQKQQIYLLPYTLYLYYQINNFPSSLLAIQSYNLTDLISRYYQKVDSQITILSSYPFSNLVENNATYTMVYANYQKQMTTSSTSIVDFMTIAKKSLVTNNANFFVSNQQALDVIVSSYQTISMGEFNVYMTWVQTVLIGFVAGFIFLALIVLALVLKTRFLARELFKVYTKLTQKQINDCIQRYEELLEAGKYQLYSEKKVKKKLSHLQFKSTYSDLNQNASKQETSQAYSKLNNKDSIVQEKKPQNKIQIKQVSNGKLILRYSYFLCFPLLCCAYFFIYMTNIQTYYTNSSLVLQKNQNLKNAIITIVKKAQKFYQASMVEQINPNASNVWTLNQKNSIDINFDIQLPPQFNSYLAQQKKILNYDLCNYLEPNFDSLYSNISCYAILDGIMSKGLTQTFILYSNLIQDYGGTMMSQFGNVYRQNAKYPVFMEIIYIRYAVCGILSKLQSQFNTTTFQYIDSQNSKIKGDLMKGLVVVPLLFIFIVYVISAIYEESKAVIKAFRVLPRAFLLNIRTTKFLKTQEILDKMQMIPL